ncbi:MAG: ZIP family metal transporter [Patescibacteria group bacterium]
MTIIYLYTLAAVIIVSLVSLVSIFFLSLREDLLKKYTSIFISLAVGGLLGGAFVHLIPEAFKELSNVTLTSILIITGILLFFIIEKFLHWHHHENDCKINHPKPVGKLILLTDGLHNFIDGVIIGASFLVSIPVGIATTLAVILHEIPQEIGDFAVLIHAGYSKKRALWLNFLSALTAVLGAIFILLFGEIVESSVIWMLPIAAGGFIYIAIADLIPELQKTKKLSHSFAQISVVIIGIALMLLLLLIE